MKMNQPQKINRINYIVQENPEGVAKLLRSEGIVIPQNLQELILTTKEWVSKEGKSAILKLLQEHPEKDLLLSLNQADQFENYSGCGCKSSFTGGDCGCKSSFTGGDCGCNSSYTGKENTCKRCRLSTKKMKEAQFIEGLKELREEQLETLYQDLKESSAKHPENKRMKKEVELTWEFMRNTLIRDKKIPREAVIQTLSKPQIAPTEKKSSLEVEAPTKAKVRKRKGNSTLFTVSTKEFAISGIVIGVALLIAQFKS